MVADGVIYNLSVALQVQKTEVREKLNPSLSGINGVLLRHELNPSPSPCRGQDDTDFYDGA